MESMVNLRGVEPESAVGSNAMKVPDRPLPRGWAPLRLTPKALRTYVNSPAGAFEVVAASKVVAADVSVGVIVSSATVVVVVS